MYLQVVFLLTPLNHRAQGVFPGPDFPLGFWEGAGYGLLFNQPALPCSLICKPTEACEEFESSLSQLLSAHRTLEQLEKGNYSG